MARPKLPTTPAVEAPMNEQALAQANQAATELVLLNENTNANAIAVASQIGYEGEVNVSAVEARARFFHRRTAEDLLELGKALLVLRELCPHGQFIDRVEAIGVTRLTAHRFMSAALKFSNVSTSKHFIAAADSASKLIELLVLDDEEVAELAAEGTVRGLAADRIGSMSVSEARAKLRDAEANLEAKDRVITNLSAKVNEQAEQIEKPFNPREGSIAKTAEDASALDALTAATNSAEADFIKLAQSVDVLQQNTSEAIRARALQAVQYLVVRMRDIVLEYGLEVSVSDDALGTRPEFLDWKA